MQTEQPHAVAEPQRRAVMNLCTMGRWLAIVVTVGATVPACKTTTATTRTEPVIEGTKVTDTRHEPGPPVITARLYGGQKVLFSVHHPLRCVQTVVTTTKVTVTQETKLDEPKHEPRSARPGQASITDVLGGALTDTMRMMAASRKQYDERTERPESVVSDACAKFTPAQGPVLIYLPLPNNESRNLGSLDEAGEFILDMAMLDVPLAACYAEAAGDQLQLQLGSDDAAVIVSVQDGMVRASEGDLDHHALNALVTLPIAEFPEVRRTVARMEVQQRADDAKLARQHAAGDASRGTDAANPSAAQPTQSPAPVRAPTVVGATDAELDALLNAQAKARGGNKGDAWTSRPRAMTDAQVRAARARHGACKLPINLSRTMLGADSADLVGARGAPSLVVDAEQQDPAEQFTITHHARGIRYGGPVSQEHDFVVGNWEWFLLDEADRVIGYDFNVSRFPVEMRTMSREWPGFASRRWAEVLEVGDSYSGGKKFYARAPCGPFELSISGYCAPLVETDPSTFQPALREPRSFGECRLFKIRVVYSAVSERTPKTAPPLRFGK